MGLAGGAPETVRGDQWDELKAVYVDDKYKLGIKEWFDQNNPQAQAQIIERMLEAARKEYWHADAKTIAELAQRWRELAERHDIVTENVRFREYVATAAGGYGLSAQAAPDAAQAPAEPAASAAPPAQVQGQRLEKQAQAEPPPAPVPWPALLALAVCAAAFAGGLLRQARRMAVPFPLSLVQGA